MSLFSTSTVLQFLKKADGAGGGQKNGRVTLKEVQAFAQKVPTKKNKAVANMLAQYWGVFEGPQLMMTAVWDPEDRQERRSITAERVRLVAKIDGKPWDISEKDLNAKTAPKRGGGLTILG